MRREKKKRNKIIIGLISILLLMSAGYAAFQTNLNIKGTSKISSNWDIRITNVTSGNKTGNGENAKTPTWTNLTASMEANLYEKGDAMEYEVTVENKGTFDAKLENILTNIKSNNEAIKISFSGYTKGEKLYKNSSKVVNVRIEYNKDYAGTPPSTSSEVEITLDYGQAEGGTITPSNDYLVTYDCKTNGGEECSKYNEYLSEGSKIDLTYTATKSGWTFAGWNTNKDATTGLTSLEMNNADVTLYAIYKKTINVSYTKGTGVSTIGKTTDSCTMYNLSETCQITLPSITTLTGYGVDGWYNSSNTKVGTEGTKINVSSNITYTAKGKANPYTLTYNYNGATGGNTTTSKAVTYNSTYGTLPTPTRSYVVTYNYNSATGGNTTTNATSNYTFNGWYKESTFANQVTSSTIYNIAGNSTIYAKWTGTSVILPTPTRTGYTFGGWYSDSSLTNKIGDSGSIYTPTSSLTLYAKWTDTTKPTVSLNPNTQATYVSGGKAVTVTLADQGSGLKASQAINYAWSTSNTTAPTTWSSVASTNTAGAKSATVTVPATSNSSLTGTYYLWIKAGTLADVSGNTSNQVVSAAFKFDNTNPTLSVSASKTTKSITAVATASALSGISKYEFSKDNGSTWVNNGTSNTYTFTGLTHNTSYNIKVRVTSGVSRQTTSSAVATTTNTISTPTYSSANNGEVLITYPGGCGSTYTCSYIKDGGTAVTVTGNTTVYFGANGTLIAKVSDGTNTVTASTYSVVRNDLYVSSTGNDTTGYGTKTKPYATLQKAYDAANSTANINIMNNITQSSTVNMNASKNITLQSYSTTGTINSIIRSASLTNYVIDHTSGTTTLKDIVIDGNNVDANYPAIILRENSVDLFVEEGTTLKNCRNISETQNDEKTNVSGAISRRTGNVTINDGSLMNNYASWGGAVNSSPNDGHFIINKGNFSYNTAIYGGAVNASNITINGGVFSHNTATLGGVIAYDKNTTINGGTYEYNEATNGGAFYAVDTADVTVKNVNINNNSAIDTGGAITNFGTLVIENSTVINNTSEINGGAIYNRGNCTIKNGTYSSNTATTRAGGGIMNLGILNINGATISKNTAKTLGGGVYTGCLDSACGTTKINSGNIINNIGYENAGGIYGAAGTTINFVDGLISENQANTYSGGGIDSYGTVIISGGTISNNTSITFGGGLMCRGTCTITGGTISGNKAPSGNGGGIRVTGSLTLNGGIIKNNTAQTNGGISVDPIGKYTYKSGTVTGNKPTNSYETS